MKEIEEGGREGGGKGEKEGRQGRASSLFKEGTPSSKKNRWFCPSRFQPLEDAKGLEAQSRLAAGPVFSGSQVIGVRPLALQPPPKLRRYPHGCGGVEKSSA